MTPSSIAPSRRCRCQSSGLVMVRLVVNGGPRLVDHFQAGLKPVRLPGQSKGNEDAALPMVSRLSFRSEPKVGIPILLYGRLSSSTPSATRSSSA